MEYTIYPVKTVGIYAKDAEQNPWATFEIVNGTVECQECHVQINRGWARGKLGEEIYLCSNHVHMVRQDDTQLG